MRYLSTALSILQLQRSFEKQTLNEALNDSAQLARCETWLKAIRGAELDVARRIDAALETKIKSPAKPDKLPQGIAAPGGG